jgi:hypothetical protein
MADPPPGDPHRLILDVSSPSQEHRYFACASTDLRAAREYFVSRECVVEVTPCPEEGPASWGLANSVTVHPSVPPIILETGRVLVEQARSIDDLNSFLAQIESTPVTSSRYVLPVPPSSGTFNPTAPSGSHFNQHGRLSSQHSSRSASLPSIPDIAAISHDQCDDVESFR